VACSNQVPGFVRDHFVMTEIPLSFNRSLCFPGKYYTHSKVTRFRDCTCYHRVQYVLFHFIHYPIFAHTFVSSKLRSPYILFFMCDKCILQISSSGVRNMILPSSNPVTLLSMNIYRVLSRPSEKNSSA